MIKKIISILTILFLGFFISLSNVTEHAENEPPGMITSNSLLDPEDSD